MDAYRKEPVPAIYTQLEFVRASRGILADCFEDVPNLKRIQNIVRGVASISELESPHEIIVKAEFPDNILCLTGDSDKPIEWRYYYWKLWDAECLVGRFPPAEAIDPRDAGIDDLFLDSLGDPTSCLPLLRKTEEVFNNGGRKGYTLTQDMASQLAQLEKPLFARYRLKAMKRLSRPAKPKRARRSVVRSISLKLRQEILQRDGYRCIFCRDSSEGKIEANHIIPRSLIDKLHLDPALDRAAENLCATCFDCNRGKRDHLTREDISFYTQRFADPAHHNHGIVQYLRMIAQLQTL